MLGHGKRRCPVDGQRLIEDRVDPFHRNVVVDACALCHGMFLDKGELLALTGNKQMLRRLQRPTAAQDSQHACSGCRGTMYVEAVDQVSVDVCTSCKGIWLDGGELEALQHQTGAESARFSPQSALERVFARWA